MSQIQQILDNPILIIVSAFALIYAVKELDNLITWIKGKLGIYHQNAKEDENLKDEIQTISCVSNDHTQSLQKLTEAVNDINNSVMKLEQNINEKLDDIEAKRKEDQVISDRATLYQLYKDFHGKDKISLAEYECFHNIAERYQKNGGNGAFHQKVIPLIEKMEISEDS